MKGVGNRKLAIAMLLILMLAVIPLFAFHVEAAQVTTPDVLEWIQPNGEAVNRSLCRNPEWLKVHTITRIHHDTWIHVLGKDCYGQNIEAKTLIPAGTPIESNIPLIDWYSGENVTFSKITDVYQEDGEHCTAFEIHTMPEPKEDHLGIYHFGLYEPTIVEYPVEPSNPDPLKIAVNWHDVDGDGVPEDANHTPDPGEFINLPTRQSTITIIGLDQCGNMISRDVVIPIGARIVRVDPSLTDKTWSTVCTVIGGDTNISYDIFTDPEPQRGILVFHILIHEIEIVFDDKNILADGRSSTDVDLVLLDIDSHRVHWAVNDQPYQSAPNITINVATTGGKIEPSCHIEIPGCNTCAHTTLTSDTNARIVKVSVVAYVPAVVRGGVEVCDEMTLFDADDACFDGVNSAPTCIPDYPYRAKIVRIEDGIAQKEDYCGPYYAAYITLIKGCNFISIPVVPDEELYWQQLPGAEQLLKCVCTYYNHQWCFNCFDGPSPDPPIPIVDGVGYWVKAKENCTLVISGRFMESCKTPPSYQMCIGWNMVGVTEIESMTTMSYLGSLNIEEALKLYGPVWAFRVDHWVRNPTNVYPGEALWVFSYDGILAP
jgi:hypothetical protein